MGEVEQLKCKNTPIPVGMQRQSCKCCNVVDGFDWHVPDEIWAAVVPEQYRNLALCLACFDDFAQAQGIDYREDLQRHPLYFAGVEWCMEWRKA